MNARALLLTIAFTAACSGAPPASEPPPAPPSSAPPSSAPPSTVAAPATSPCAADADCRMYSGPACSCLPALQSATVAPDPTPCFVAPCMNHEPYCDAGTHACMIRAATPPPATSGAPSLDDIPAVS